MAEIFENRFKVREKEKTEKRERKLRKGGEE